MRTFLLFVTACLCLSAFSQKPVEEEQVISPDSIQELARQKPDADTDIVIVNPHKPPVFPGGEKELLRFLAENTYWPKGCGDANIVGRIIVQFVIDTTGDWSELKILKMPSKCFEPMVADIFAKMPCWEPGEFENRKERTRMTLPIRIHWE